MRVFKLKYKDGRLSEPWYYSFYWRGKKIRKRISGARGNIGCPKRLENITSPFLASTSINASIS